MSAQAFRMAAGGRIDRAKPVSFVFNGRKLQGYAGDTLASALLANGVHLVGRSFKYHRPRGILSAGPEEPCALVQVGDGPRTEPNLRATQVELHQGLIARSVNAWPSVETDFGAVNNLFSKLFVAGFYYKTFMHPKSWWMRVYEPAIRRAAGLGRAPEEPDPDIYDKMHAHCDVLIAGGGPAGLMAALAAARTGAHVVLADEQNEFGGSLLGATDLIDGRPAAAWAASIIAELAAGPEVMLLPRTTVAGYYDHNYLVLAERRADGRPAAANAGRPRQRLWKVRARQVVLATGAHERPVVFADNDRPGIMLASAARSYVNRYGVLPGRRAVVFTNNDSAYAAALDMAAAGIEIVGLVDLRPNPAGPLPSRARQLGLPIHTNAAIVRTRGRKRLAAIEVMALSSDGTAASGAPTTLGCDLLAMSGGWNPAVHLFSQSQGRLRYDEEHACFVPDASVQAERSAGACKGSFDLAACLAEGAAAGAEAAAAAGFGDGRASAPPSTTTVPAEPLRPIWIVPGTDSLGHGAAKHFVDLQNDVTAADILLASREGFHSVEHVKRYTTTGMGTDQGKTSNVNALAILAKTLASPIAAVGTTTFRPPYTPVAYGTLAGRDVGDLADPARVTPMHAWHVEQGAVFEDVGQWKRPHYFPRGDEDMTAAVRRECRAVREGVGILDASTLGKIDVQGPDAAAFLDRIYVNGWSRLDIGRCRYGLMCTEDGMVLDDGVTARLGHNHFLMHTTTGNAARVLDWLEEWLQTEWSDLNVYLTSVTDHWATASLSGPKARAVLAGLTEDIDLDPKSFPFMSVREGTVAGRAARLFRVSFTGELTYEINVAAQHGLQVWREIMRAGAKHDLTPFGTEAMHVLRAEKGFIVVGQETDGAVTPVDLGMERMISRRKDFLGKRSLARPEMVRAGRKQFVGLLTADPDVVLSEGCQITETRDLRPPVPMLGHVTSSYWSETLGRSIALALVKGGRERMGETVYAPIAGGPAPCTLVEPIFYDREGARARG